MLDILPSFFGDLRVFTVMGPVLRTACPLRHLVSETPTCFVQVRLKDFSSTAHSLLGLSELWMLLCWVPTIRIPIFGRYQGPPWLASTLLQERTWASDKAPTHSLQRSKKALVDERGTTHTLALGPSRESKPVHSSAKFKMQGNTETHHCDTVRLR